MDNWRPFWLGLNFPSTDIGEFIFWTCVRISKFWSFARTSNQDFFQFDWKVNLGHGFEYFRICSLCEDGMARFGHFGEVRKLKDLRWMPIHGCLCQAVSPSSLRFFPSNCECLSFAFHGLCPDLPKGLPSAQLIFSALYSSAPLVGLRIYITHLVEQMKIMQIISALVSTRVVLLDSI